jgi:hypothetical protein
VGLINVHNCVRACVCVCSHINVSANLICPETTHIKPSWLHRAAVINAVGVPSSKQQYPKVFIMTARPSGPRGLSRRSTAARLLRSWSRIPPGAWMPLCCLCCVLSGRGLCDELFTHPEESYRLWCVVVCDLEKQKPREWGGQDPLGGYHSKRKKIQG